VDRCLAEVYRTAYRLCGRSDEAEELAHDAFVKARRAIAQLPPEASDRAWLFRILRNAWIDRRRRAARAPEVASPEPESEETRPAEKDADALPPVVDVATVEQRRALEQRFDDHVLEALDALPDELRVALYFQVFGGLDYREIAVALDCPVGTVMSRLHRAKSRLRRSLATFAEHRGLLGSPRTGPAGEEARDGGMP